MKTYMGRYPSQSKYFPFCHKGQVVFIFFREMKRVRFQIKILEDLINLYLKDVENE